VLLSTHHLDEADMIGDRVAILHKGCLMCCGSPLYLKQNLGSGYNLKIDKQGHLLFILFLLFISVKKNVTKILSILQ